MRTYWKAVSLILLILILIPPIYSKASDRRIAFTRVPAVYQTPDGISKGSLGNLTVEVEPGEGYVYFSADPLTQIDTQGAARTAALVASYTLGEDPLSYDFYYRLESNSMIIGGPSAGAAMTAATIAAMLGKEMKQDVLITGMINPDGTIGPVGGIPEKLEAAARGGAKIFLVPAGQRVIERAVPKEVKIGPLIMTRIEKEKVDLAELGKKLGVKVIEVSTIAEAVKYLVGVEAKTPPSVEPKLPNGVRSVLEKWVNHYLKESKAIRSYVKSNLSKLSYIAKQAIQKIVNISERLSKEAEEEMKQCKYYTASSSAFQSTFEAEYARALLDYALKGPNAVNDLMSRVDSRVKEVGSKLNSTKPDSFSSLEALIAAKTRYYLAKDALETGARLASKKVYFDSATDWGALHWLAYAYWRAETADTWTWLFGIGRGGNISETRLRKVASVLLYEAESVVSYALSLLQDIGASSDLLNEASDDLDRAGIAFSSDDIYGSLGLTTSALAKATASIHQWFTSDPVAVQKAVRSISYSSINELISRGIVPVLALSYAETARVYEERRDVFNSIVYYELSSAHAHMLSLLSKVGSEAKVETPQNTNTEITPPKTETPLTTTSSQIPTSTQPPSKMFGISGSLLLLMGALLIGLLAGYLLGRR